ncbi:MAG: xanthine dehydrogenase family protein subunit M [Pseudomonadota bacterium]
MAEAQSVRRTGFQYFAPQALDDALTVLAEHTALGERVQVLAGGTDMLVQLQSVDRDPRAILDLKRLPETMQLTVEPDTVRIGSAVPSAVLNEHAALKRLFPGLLEAADLIGSTQIQGRASVGGNLCNASPAGDSIPALIANAAVCELRSSTGARELPVEAFVVGVQRNALEAGEMLVSLRLPVPPERSADAYLRFTPRTEMDIAVAGCGVRLALDERGVCTAARIGIGAVAPTALLVPEAGAALVGTRLEDTALAAAGAACANAANPISDKRGTVEFRKKIIAVLCRRATAIARDRALAGTMAG